MSGLSGKPFEVVHHACQSPAAGREPRRSAVGTQVRLTQVAHRVHDSRGGRGVVVAHCDVFGKSLADFPGPAAQRIVVIRGQEVQRSRDAEHQGQSPTQQSVGDRADIGNCHRQDKREKSRALTCGKAGAENGQVGHHHPDHQHRDHAHPSRRRQNRSDGDEYVPHHSETGEADGTSSAVAREVDQHQ